jgi:penicillin-binding protein A
MNKAILRISLACLAMFVLLLVNINYVQAFQGAKLAGEPGNIRVFNQQFTFQRGSIVATGDQGKQLTVARSVLVKGTNMYRREYPNPQVYAPITGYDTIYSQTGIEAAENKELNGTDPRLAINNLTALLTGKQKQGATVALTISPAAQQAAYNALVSDPAAHGHPAAAVAMDPTTGAILAMASYPSFDPNPLTTFDGTALNKAYNRLNKDPAQPLLNRAVTPDFPPGSSFKIVTSSAAFSNRLLANTQTTLPAPQPLRLPNGNLMNNDGSVPCANGNPPVIEAFYLSCNTAFGKLGIRLTAPVLRDYATKFGMNQTFDIPFPVEPGLFPKGPGWTDPSLTAFSAIGQFNDEVSPLQEAMFASAIANGGTLMKPYLVRQVLGPGLAPIQSASPTVLSQPVSQQVATNVKAMMYQVTHNQAGTAYATAGPPVTSIPIYGKTGTAENGLSPAQSPDDAVFSCFVPAGAGVPPIAVGVIVKGGGFGADAAAPIAVKIIQAYLAANHG